MPKYSNLACFVMGVSLMATLTTCEPAVSPWVTLVAMIPGAIAAVYMAVALSREATRPKVRRSPARYANGHQARGACEQCAHTLTTSN